MTRNFANGNGCTYANGQSVANGPPGSYTWAYRVQGWDIRPATFWDYV